MEAFAKVCDFDELKLGTIVTDGFGRVVSIVNAAKMTAKKPFGQTTPTAPGFYACVLGSQLCRKNEVLKNLESREAQNPAHKLE